MEKQIKSYAKITATKIYTPYERHREHLKFDVEMFISNDDFNQIGALSQDIEIERLGPSYFAISKGRDRYRFKKLKNGYKRKLKNYWQTGNLDYGLESGIYDIEILHNAIGKYQIPYIHVKTDSDNSIPEKKFQCPECGGNMIVKRLLNYEYVLACDSCNLTYDRCVSIQQAAKEFKEKESEE